MLSQTRGKKINILTHFSLFFNYSLISSLRKSVFLVHQAGCAGYFLGVAVLFEKSQLSEKRIMIRTIRTIFLTYASKAKKASCYNKPKDHSGPLYTFKWIWNVCLSSKLLRKCTCIFSSRLWATICVNVVSLIDIIVLLFVYFNFFLHISTNAGSAFLLVVLHSKCTLLLALLQAYCADHFQSLNPAPGSSEYILYY